jgi:NAD+ synthase (glutamine-hydrolysing)
MRLGLAQINTIVGDLPGNRRKILEAYSKLVADGAELVLFPELIVCGYPPRDLLFKKNFATDVQESLSIIKQSIGNVPALIGTIEINTTGVGRPFYNSAAFCHQGKVVSYARKCLLPTYDVFDEDRYFEPAPKATIIVHDGKKIGVTICEDIWTHPMINTRGLYHGLDPVKQLAQTRLDLMVNLSASPWHNEKGNIRQTLVTDAAFELDCPVAYVNAVGGNDELIFDGRSLVSDASGHVLMGLAAFAEDLRVVPLNLDPQASANQERQVASSYTESNMADIFSALRLGLKDYAQKSGFKKSLVALSGGIDSAIVGVLAVAAFGAENVTGVSLPSAISSQHSKDDAKALAKTLGIAYLEIPIAESVACAELALKPAFTGKTPDVTEENIQARVRGVLMMALSNKFGALLLTTGNKSEMAVGYCTLYGDMCGGLAVISDLYKTQVYSLARYINEDARLHGKEAPIPQSTIDKPPSAELRPDQKDQDSLPEYSILDGILKACIEDGLSRKAITALGFDAALVDDIVKKIDRSEYKRKQAAPGLKITPLAFGVGRRIPIVHGYTN